MPEYFEFEVELAGVEPRIWRRFLLPADATFLDLHQAIQDACGWSDYHMFDFFEKRPCGESIAGIPDETGMTDREIPDAAEKGLSSYFGTGKGKKKTCGYLYDFGDDWLHKVKLKKVVELEEEFPRRLVAGARAFPPEDCGGVWGYETCVEIATGVAKPDPDDPHSREEIESRREWLGDWEPERFDLEAVKETFDKGRPGRATLEVVRKSADGDFAEIGEEDVEGFDEVMLRIDMAAESRGSTEFWQTPIACFARAGRRRCGGRLLVRLSGDLAEAAWRCPECGDEGSLRWRGDVQREKREASAAGGRLVTSPVPCEEYEALMEQFSLSGDADLAVFAAGWDGRRVVIEASEEVLEDLVEGVAAEANHARGKRRKLLDSLGDRIEKALG